MVPRGDTRQRLIESAFWLFREKGFHGTSLAEITERPGIPRGSFSFHFPGGKDEIAAEVVKFADSRILASLAEFAGAGTAPELVAALFDAALADLVRSEFGRGCAVAAVALDMPFHGAGSLQHQCGAAFDAWAGAMQAVLERDGVAPARAARVASMAVIALEGGLVVARASGDPAPLALARDEIVRMFRNAVELNEKDAVE